ncbi:MAG: RHS repeat-associated core domain-containing protein, partial [Phycisphaerales bacterium]
QDADSGNLTPSLDNTTKQLTTHYDPRGRVWAVISHNATYDALTSPPGTDSAMNTILQGSAVQNFIKYDYNHRGLITRLRQGAEGQLPASGTGKVRDVTYSYESGTPTAWNPGSGAAVIAYQRTSVVQHPDPITPVNADDDTYVSFLYNTPVDDALSRPGALGITDGTLEGMPFVQYQRLGIGTIAVTDFLQMGIQLDRTVETNGHRSAAGYSDNPGRYGGWDKFGRLTLNSWVNVGFHNNNRPMLWQERYAYDLSTRKLSRAQLRTNFENVDQDWAFAYDKLDRLTSAQRGQLSGSPPSLTATTGSLSWTLDNLGNWTRQSVKDSAGHWKDEDRTHNATNELTAIGSDARLYDANGNLRRVRTGTSTDKQKLTYDAWNRLVKAETLVTTSGGDVWETVQYQYNPLHWRVREQREMVDLGSEAWPPHGAETSIRRVYYSAGWQVLLEDVEGSGDTPSRREQQFWGLRGVDDAVYRRVDIDNDGVYTGEGDSAFYQLTDSLFSVVAHIDGLTGSVRQRMSYDPYGRMRLHHPADYDAGGTLTGKDESHFLSDWYSDDPRADFNGDGVVDSNDQDEFGWLYTNPHPIDEVRVGFCGYLRDPSTGWWLARNRWYDAEAGRWINRDPAGYIDGLNFYLYVRCNPMSLVDPTGLMPPDGRSTDMMAMRNSPEAQSVTAAAWDQMSDSPAGTMSAGAYIGFGKSSYNVATGVVALVTDPVTTIAGIPAGFKNGVTGAGAKILGAIFNNDGAGNPMSGLQRASDFGEGVSDLAYMLLPVKGAVARSSRAAAAATAGARPSPAVTSRPSPPETPTISGPGVDSPMPPVNSSITGPGLDNALGFSTQTITTPTTPLPALFDYSTYSRPGGYRVGVRDTVFRNAQKASPDGAVRSPGGSVIDPGVAWDMGHIVPFRIQRAWAWISRRTRSEFLNEQNKPSNYRPETPSDNRSHKYE